ncbi:sugar transferase [Planctobacterium marinum]|uniref:sugar transferase n=1 Tax=Planctobacterium marinum TaxID=1631968 RepID=UPI001E5DA55B|nr:sugar transferase [Planctobacterium marinum]MCC2606138.1 sugar transferase [Planctobacterium marinum]
MYRSYFKRLLDILLSLTAFIFLSPLFIITAILIKLFDPGPLIFSQMRVGRDAKEFRFFKFRSMPVNTGDIPSDKIGKVKLTWIGKLIRRTNIDELPQLYNILIGDMSIVGPRPPIPAQKDLVEARKLNGSIGLRPGLTGLAQVNSFDGMTVSQKAEFDGIYTKNFGFLQDLKIILNTILYLFKPPPTY